MNDDRIHAPEIADAARVMAWARDPNRKPAHLAFTAGAERQAAYWIEWAEAEGGAKPGAISISVEPASLPELLAAIDPQPDRKPRASTPADIAAAIAAANIVERMLGLEEQSLRTVMSDEQIAAVRRCLLLARKQTAQGA